MAEAAKQRVITLLRGEEARRIRFTAATASAGDIIINPTTFATVATAIEMHRIKVTVRTHFDDGSGAQYDSEAVPALGTIPGFSSGQLLVPPIVGREQESSVMHECTHAFFDLQSIDISATEEEAICYVVGALYDRMTGLPRARWGTPLDYQSGYVVAGGLLQQYQRGGAAVPRVDDTDFKTVVLAVATSPFYFLGTAGLIHWLSGKDNRYDNDG
jgi:hypothetical protein